jgi:hypothetical protein
MKKLTLTAVTFISFLFISCGGGSSTPTAPSPKVFNDTAIKIFQGANKALEEFDGKITTGVKSGDLASIAVAADAANTAVDTQIGKLNDLIAPEGGEGYKEAVMKSLESVKSLIEIGRKYSALPEGYSKKEFNDLEKEYNNKRKDLSNDLKNVGKAQTEFSKSSK